MPTVVASFAPIATGTSTKTLLQLTASSTQALRILEVCITFAGTDTVGAPIEVQLLRQTNTPTSVAATDAHGSENSSYAEALTAVETFDSEPTAGDILRRWYVHPQAGLIYTNPWPDRLQVPESEIVGLRVISPGATVNATGYISVEE
jgi:hypothetical protein